MELDSLTRTVDAFKKQLDEKDDTIEELTEKLRKTEASIEFMDAEIDENHETIATLRRALSEMQAQMGMSSPPPKSPDVGVVRSARSRRKGFEG